MNTKLITIVAVALIGGAAIGSYMQTKQAPSPAIQEAIRNQEQTRLQSENPPAADYVSMRPGIEELPAEALSQAEIDGLMLMREEEKLARDVYQTLYDQWGLRIFTNIAQSEQTHTEAVYDLLEKYNLSDPVTDDTIGVFTNPDLQQFYNDFVAAGSASEVAALTVGATIEDLDIKDLMDLSAQTDNQDILLVYSNLTRGSRNHMRAFTRQLAMRGETYTPQHISAEEYNSIITSEQETGMQQNATGNTGRGWGKRGGNQGGGQGGNR